MRANLVKITFLPLTIVAFSILVGTASCRSHRSFHHYSIVFELSLQGAGKLVPDSRTEVSLISIDHEQSRGLFRITRLDSGESAEEWVVSGDFFRSGFGSRGLRLSALRSDGATLQRFGVK